jgi:type I restriction enzyme S subunit
MKGWAKRTIGALCDAGGGEVKTGPFGAQLHQSDYQLEGTPVVMPTDIVDGKFDVSRVARVADAHVDRLHKHKLSKGDIVYGRRGDIGRQALVRKENIGWLCGTGCLRVSLGNAEVLPEFLHLYLSLPEIASWVENQAVGATMPNLNTGILRRVPVLFPTNKTVQRKIVSAIFTYDDLIENNKRRIALLEKMAEEIYREWFVRLRFPGHGSVKVVKGVPEGWETGKLGDIINLTMGQSPKSEFYNETGDGLSFNQGVGTYGERFPKRVTFCSVDGRKAKTGDILFSVRAPVGRLNIADCDMIIGRGLAAIRHKKGKNGYLYYFMKVVFSNEDIIGNGSIFNSVGKDELNGFPILKPNDELVEKFNSVAGNVDNQIALLFEAQERLIRTRDMLLPRLISGKLSVENLDIQFPPGVDT